MSTIATRLLHHGGFKPLVDYKVHESGIAELTLWDGKNLEEFVEFQDWEDIEHIIPPEEEETSLDGVAVKSSPEGSRKTTRKETSMLSSSGTVITNSAEKVWK